MIKRFSIITALFAVAFFVQVAQAQSIKIGYANPDLIIGQLPEFATIQKELQALAKKREAEVAVKRDSLVGLFQKYQQVAATLSPQQNEVEQTKLQALNDELQEIGNSARLELQRKQAELFQPLYAKVQQAIQDVAKELSLDFVFNSTTSNGDAIILFVDDAQRAKLDITEKVIAKINKK